MRDWVRANGGSVSESLGVGYFHGTGGGWGLKALAPLSAGEQLVRVPDGLILSVERVLLERPAWRPLADVLDVCERHANSRAATALHYTALC